MTGGKAQRRRAHSPGKEQPDTRLLCLANKLRVNTGAAVGDTPPRGETSDWDWLVGWLVGQRGRNLLEFSDNDNSGRRSQPRCGNGLVQADDSRAACHV